MEIRKEVSKKEDLLYHATALVSDYSWSRKQKINTQWAITFKDALEIMQIPCNNIDKKLLKKIVCGACRAGSRFNRGCIAFQLYGDSDKTIEWAIKHGAIAVVTNKKVDGVPCIIVKDPTQAYVKLCNYYRNISKAEITAVVGSIGKTTTKKMVNLVYGSQFVTFNDPENENQIDCVGYICQHIPNDTEKIVQEVSEDIVGSVSNISNIIHPKIAIVTAIDHSHFEEFGSKEKILDEIISIESGMPEDGIVIINSDELDRTLFNKNTITISKEDKNADYFADNIIIDSKGLNFSVIEKNGRKTKIFLNDIFAEHNVYSALYAFAAGICSGVNRHNIVEGLKKYRSTGIRQNVYRSHNNIIIYADCYNAVPKSIKSAIEASEIIPISGRRIAVLGDVASAGELTEKTHADIASIINESKFDIIITSGRNLKIALSGIKKRTTLKIVSCKNNAEIAKVLKKILAPGDLVLFKASRTSKLEDIIKSTFPSEYKKQMLYYYKPIVRWRIKVILS